jgi:hypothetical protein
MGSRIVFPWPMPALLAWALCWALYFGLSSQGLPTLWAGVAATAAGGLLARRVRQSWRRWILAVGFPLSYLLRGDPTSAALSVGANASAGWAAGVPAWVWLGLVLALLVLYPRRAWADAPLFPTPTGALQGLSECAPLSSPSGQARILDAGCGLGAGLRELRKAYPQAQLTGWEWSWPLRLLCAVRCPWARIQRQDIWAASWSSFDLVYLFQRPESMPRALSKAQRELGPGAWMVSLEFEVPGLVPHAVLRTIEAKPVWVYRGPWGSVHNPSVQESVARKT